MQIELGKPCELGHEDHIGQVMKIVQVRLGKSYRSCKVK